MTDIHTAIERIFQEERGRMLSVLLNIVNDFALAEDCLQDALMDALQTWGKAGLPTNPTAWMTSVAKRRMIDRLRRMGTAKRHQATWVAETIADESDMDTIPDERLKLMFTCCHPALALEAQVALTLQTLGGLTIAEIARAFLIPENTMAQRLVRAKQKILQAGIPYSIPPREQLPERLDALLAVLYLVFNEGYCATSGDALVRHELCGEAIQLTRVLVGLLPDAPTRAEAEGLLALLLLHDSRRDARQDEAGNLVTLAHQDRTRWHAEKRREGIQWLEKALKRGAVGFYQLQAAISAVHAEAHTYADTDWAQIAELYGELMRRYPSAVVAVNQAVAVGMAQGAKGALAILHPLRATLASYYPFWVAYADALKRDGQREASQEALDRAIALCHNAQERAYLQQQRDIP